MVKVVMLTALEVERLNKNAIAQFKAMVHLKRELQRQNIYVTDEFLYKVIEDQLTALLIKHKKKI